MWKRGKYVTIILAFQKGTFVWISVNSKPLSSKSKLKEVRVVKLQGVDSPWVSCSKFNSVVQKAAVQNYESIWFQSNWLEVTSWPILRLRDTVSQCMRHIFLFGRKLFGFLLPNSGSKDVWDSHADVKLGSTGSSWMWRTALRRTICLKAKGWEVVAEITVLTLRFSLSVC